MLLVNFIRNLRDEGFPIRGRNWSVLGHGLAAYC
jgi:hypothetical protein